VLEEQSNVRRGYADGSVALWRDQKRVDTDVYCVDEFSTRFYDDGLSAEILDEKTTRVYVHVADVDAVVQPRGDIDRIALARGESMYLPKRPFHMIPPAAMEAASFNPVLNGLAVSVAFDVELETGGRNASSKVILPYSRILRRLSHWFLVRHHRYASVQVCSTAYY